MKLGKKTFVYTMFISSLVGLSLILFLIFFLPGLYMNSRMNRNLENAKSFHKIFVKEGKVSDDTSFSWIGFKVPMNGYKISLMSAYGEIIFDIPEGEFRESLDKFRGQDFSKIDISKEYDKEEVQKYFEFSDELRPELFKKLNLEFKPKKNQIEFYGESTQVHTVDNNTLLFESSARSSEKVLYTNFVGMTKTESGYFVSLYGEVSPSIDDIKPVILMSIPVLILLIVTIGLIGSGIFARTLTKPIHILMRDVYQRRNKKEAFSPIQIHSRDEIGELGSLLNELYDIQNKQYLELEEENKRKEVFMKAFSHQLKNPIASSLLLVDGMQGNIGKYQDRDTYLGVLKLEIKKLQKIVEEVSDFDASLKDISLQNIDMMERIEFIKNELEFELKEKNLSFSIRGEMKVVSDEKLLYKVLHNLIDNAIGYTKENGEIIVEGDGSKLQVTNYPTSIPDEIKDNLFEPLVSSNQRKHSRGLGLYIVKSFCQQLGIRLDFNYEHERVQMILEWRT